MLSNKKLRMDDIQVIWHNSDFDNFFLEITNKITLKFFDNDELIAESDISMEDTDLNTGNLVIEDFIDFNYLFDNSTPLYVKYNDKDSIEIDNMLFSKLTEEEFETKLNEQEKSNQAANDLSQKIDTFRDLAQGILYR